MGSNINDLIIRIKNSYLAKREIVTVPYSRFREAILTSLKKLGYIKDFKLLEMDGVKQLEISLKYTDGQPAISNVKIISTPGKRIYVSYKELKPVIGGMGRALISTPQGVVDDQVARKNHLGGELLFEIW